MRTTKLIALFWLVAAGLFLSHNTRAEVDTVLYHWITQDKVILWRSLADTEPVTATFDPSAGKWSFTPPDATSLWEPILIGVVQRDYPQVSRQLLKDDLLWSFALTKLRNEYKNVEWARPRLPSVEIHLRQKDEQTVELAFIHIVNGEAKQAIIKFTKQQGGKWTKAQDLPLKTLLGLTDTSGELHKVLTIPETEPLPVTREQWQSVWDRWVRSLLENNNLDHPIMYKDLKGDLQWLWRGRLGQNDNLPNNFRQMPSALPPIVEPNIQAGPERSEKQPAGYLWLGISITFNLILVAYALLFHFRNRLRKRLPSLPGWLSQRIAALWDGDNLSARPQVTLVLEVFEKLHERSRGQYLEMFKEDTSYRRMLLAGLDCVRDMYRELVNSGELQQEATIYREKIVGEYLQHDLGVEANGADQVKRWIGLGREVEDAAPQIIAELDFPDEVKNLVIDRTKARPQSKEDWLIYWPSLLIAYEKLLNERTKECSNLNQHIEEQKAQHEKAILEKQRDVEDRWKGAVDTLKKEQAKLAEECILKTSKLDRSNTEIDGLRGQITELKGELSTKGQVLESEQGRFTMLQQEAEKIQRMQAEILQVQNISRYLRRWLQGYFEGRRKTNSEIRPVALLTSLINFSLYQMCFSIIEDRQPLLKVMANNIFRFTQKFEQPTGNDSVLAAARASLIRLVPDVEAALKELRETDVGGETPDDTLFRGFLSQLSTDTGKNLDPFFIDVDRQKNTLVHVNAS